LSRHLVALGHDVKTCQDLPDVARSKDGAFNFCSLEEQRVLVTKDVGFWHTLVLQGRPWKLVLVRVGNMKLKVFIQHFVNALPLMESTLRAHDLYELMPGAE